MRPQFERFSINSDNSKFFLEKLRLNCLLAKYLREKYVQDQRKQKNVKTKSLKPKLMKKLNTNHF